MRINFNTQNFNGYNNLMHTDINSRGGRFVLLAMQLDDNDGHQDLSYFKRLLRGYDRPETDVLTLFQVNYKNYEPRLILNDSVLFDTRELYLLNNHKLMKKYSEEDLNKIKNFNIRAYTLIAKLTKRLMNVSMASNNEGIQHTIQEVSSLLNKSFPSVDYVIEILTSAFNDKKPFQKTALEINQRIDGIMKNYFKLI